MPESGTVANGLKCRECKKPPESGYVSIRGVKPATLCVECVSKHQRTNRVPVILNEFIQWYIAKHGSGDSQIGALTREVEELRRIVERYEKLHDEDG